MSDFDWFSDSDLTSEDLTHSVIFSFIEVLLVLIRELDYYTFS